MRKIIAPLIIGAALSTAFAADDSLKQEIEALKTQMAELKSAQSKMNIDALRAQVTEIKAHDSGDNLKFNVDFRTAYDVVDYKVNSATNMLGGSASDTKNGIWTNKLILGMGAQPADNLVFKGALGAYKTFGNNDSSAQNGFQGMDWYGTQSPSDSTIKLREAYFLYFGDMGDIHYSASFGRRPSVDGFMTNLRADNENPASPVGHNINMEFDGASFKFDIDKLTGISGMYVKLCLGRGNSDADARFPEFTAYNGGNFTFANALSSHTPYSTNGKDAPNMDLAGLLVQFYDDGQYKVMANYFQGWNMMGANFTSLGGGNYNVALTDVGDLTGGSLSLQVNGIGNSINDFLDDSIFFISYAYSKTDPKGTHFTLYDAAGMGNAAGSTEMLGSSDSEMGHSYYAGLQLPGFMKGQRVGLEYNHGSKYWRSFTYGEDTLVGSKLAARGDAYEIYYTLPIVGKNLTAQLSYIYIDYDYTGSDMFFDMTGKPTDVSTTPGAVESASNIRASVRYRY